MPPVTEPEIALVRRAATGDREAYGELVQRYAPLVTAMSLSRLRSPADRDDLAQEIFIKAWRALPALRELDRFRSWLCAIAANEGRDWLKQKARRPRAITMDAAPDLPDPGVEPAQAAANQESAGDRDRAVREALLELPEDARMIVMWRTGDQVPFRGIAERLGITEANARQRYFRALETLRQQLKSKGARDE